MTDPNEPDGIDTSGSTVPPYEGRRESAGGDDPGGAYRDGVRVGGATGPVTDDTGPASPPGSSGSPRRPEDQASVAGTAPGSSGSPRRPEDQASVAGTAPGSSGSPRRPEDQASVAGTAPEATPGGATGSPADEQPAEQVTATDLDDDRVGPAHQAGTPRGEDQA
jgi:hypothetical protein